MQHDQGGGTPASNGSVNKLDLIIDQEPMQFARAMAAIEGFMAARRGRTPSVSFPNEQRIFMSQSGRHLATSGRRFLSGVDIRLAFGISCTASTVTTIAPESDSIS